MGRITMDTEDRLERGMSALTAITQLLSDASCSPGGGYVHLGKLASTLELINESMRRAFPLAANEEAE